MSDKLIVLLDVDGVLADFLTPALAVASRATGRIWTTADLKSWDMFDTVGKACADACYAVFEQKGFCADLKPLEGAQDAVEQLQRIAEVHALTSPLHSCFWYHERVEWLGDHFKIPRKNVHFSARKEFFYGDILVDDKPEHVKEWAMANRYGHAFLYGHPWNALETNPFYERITSWAPVLCAVKQEVANVIRSRHI